MVTDKNLRNQTLLLEGLLFRRHNEILFTFIYGIIPRKPKEYSRYKFWWIWSICPRIKQFDPFVHLSQKQNKIKQNTKHKHKTHTHTKQDRLVNKTSTHISGFLKNQKPSYQPDKQKNRVPFPALLSSKKKQNTTQTSSLGNSPLSLSFYYETCFRRSRRNLLPNPPMPLLEEDLY